MMHCASGFAGDLLIDDFSEDASSRWEFITDGVMGGVSYGNVQFNHVEKNDVMILSGTVIPKTMAVLFKRVGHFLSTKPATTKASS